MNAFSMCRITRVVLKVLMPSAFLPQRCNISCKCQQLLKRLMKENNYTVVKIHFYSNMSLCFKVVSFFYRYFLSIGMLGLAAWPVIFPLDQSVQYPLLAGWVSSCLFLAVFPLLPVVGRDPNTQLV